jgi:hypothetical protein
VNLTALSSPQSQTEEDQVQRTLACIFSCRIEFPQYETTTMCLIGYSSVGFRILGLAAWRAGKQIELIGKEGPLVRQPKVNWQPAQFILISGFPIGSGTLSPIHSCANSQALSRRTSQRCVRSPTLTSTVDCRQSSNPSPRIQDYACGVDDSLIPEIARVDFISLAILNA